MGNNLHLHELNILSDMRRKVTSRTSSGMQANQAALHRVQQEMHDKLLHESNHC